MQVKIKKIKNWLKIGVLLVIFVLPINVNAQSCPSRSIFGSTYATLVGEITDTGGDPNISAWFEWGKSLSLINSTPIQRLNISYVPYRYCYTITNLSPCTNYYYRAIVQNSAGINYGEIRSFMTYCDSISQPSLRASCYSSPNPSYVGNVVTFYSEVSGGTGFYSYYWSGDCSGSTSVCQRVFNNPGNYYVYLTVYSGDQSINTSCSVNVLSRPIQQTATQVQLQNQKPIAEINYSPTSITPGTVVTFNSLNSYDPDGKIILYEWKINNKIVSNSSTFSRAFSSGAHKITLTVVDDKGATSSKELLINVGRTKFIPQTVVKTVTRTVRVSTPVSTTKQPTTGIGSKNQFNFVDISIDESIKASLCKKDYLNVTIINNSQQEKNITLTVNGEIKKWFKPKARIIQAIANDVNSLNWNFEIPCDTEEGEFYGVITANINGTKKDFPIKFLVVKSKGLFEPLTAFTGSIFEAKYTPWLLVLILILINFIMWYYLIFKSKSKIE